MTDSRDKKLSTQIFWTIEELQAALERVRDIEEPGRAERRRMEINAKLDREPELDALAKAVVKPRYVDSNMVAIDVAAGTFDLLEARWIMGRISFLLTDDVLRSRGKGDD